MRSCAIMYTAKKSYFALSALSEFLQACAGCLKAAGFSYVLVCTRRLKIPSHLRTLSEFLQACAGCSNKQPVFLCTTLYIAIPILVATKKQPLIKRTVFLLDYAGASAGFFSSALRSEE